MGCSSSTPTPSSTPTSSSYESTPSVKELAATPVEHDKTIKTDNFSRFEEDKDTDEQNEGRTTRRGQPRDPADHATHSAASLTSNNENQTNTDQAKPDGTDSVNHTPDIGKQNDKGINPEDKKIDKFATELQLSLKNILIKAEQKKRKLYATEHCDGDKATIHLSHSFRDTAPVSPVQSKETNVETETVEEVQDFWADEPIETAETETNGEEDTW